MEPSNKISVKYNGKTVNLELPNKYKDFLQLIQDKFFLSPELMKCISISYLDEDDLSNLVYDEDSYEISLTEHFGKWEIKLELSRLIDDDNISKNSKNSQNNNNLKKFDKKDKKILEENIAKKYASIFKKKLEEKNLEHKKEISKMENDFKNTMNTVIQKNEESYEQLSQYYNEKMKEYFQKYNDLVIDNLNKGISQSELKELADQFIKDNQIPNRNHEENDEDLGAPEGDFNFSKLIK